MRATLRSLITAVREVGRTGDPAQRQSARAVIENAVRAIWALLADGPVTSEAVTESVHPAGEVDAREAPAPEGDAQQAPASGADAG